VNYFYKPHNQTNYDRVLQVRRWAYSVILLFRWHRFKASNCVKTDGYSQSFKSSSDEV